MPTSQRIRQLCDRVVTAQGEEFEKGVLELLNAIESHTQIQEMNGNQTAKAEQSTMNGNQTDMAEQST